MPLPREKLDASNTTAAAPRTRNMLSTRGFSGFTAKNLGGNITTTRNLSVVESLMSFAKVRRVILLTTRTPGGKAAAVLLLFGMSASAALFRLLTSGVRSPRTVFMLLALLLPSGVAGGRRTTDAAAARPGRTLAENFRERGFVSGTISAGFLMFMNESWGRCNVTNGGTSASKVGGGGAAGEVRGLAVIEKRCGRRRLTLKRGNQLQKDHTCALRTMRDQTVKHKCDSTRCCSRLAAGSCFQRRAFQTSRDRCVTSLRSGLIQTRALRRKMWRKMRVDSCGLLTDRLTLLNIMMQRQRIKECREPQSHRRLLPLLFC